MRSVRDQLTGPKDLVPLVADRAVIHSYLRELYGTADTGYLPSSLHQVTGPIGCRLPTRIGRRVIQQRCDEGCNVYHGMGLHRAPLGPTRRGTADDVIALPGLFMDLDIADPRRTRKPRCRGASMMSCDLLADFPLPPIAPDPLRARALCPLAVP